MFSNLWLFQHEQGLTLLRTSSRRSSTRSSKKSSTIGFAVQSMSRCTPQHHRSACHRDENVSPLFSHLHCKPDIAAMS